LLHTAEHGDSIWRTSSPARNLGEFTHISLQPLYCTWPWPGYFRSLAGNTPLCETSDNDCFEKLKIQNRLYENDIAFSTLWFSVLYIVWTYMSEFLSPRADSSWYSGPVLVPQNIKSMDHARSNDFVPRTDKGECLSNITLTASIMLHVSCFDAWIPALVSHSRHEDEEPTHRH
jgi:hypothetical protein